MITAEQARLAKAEMKRRFPTVSFGLGGCEEGFCVEARTAEADLPDRVLGVPVQVREPGVTVALR